MFASNDANDDIVCKLIKSESFGMIDILHYGHSWCFVLTVVRWHSNNTMFDFY